MREWKCVSCGKKTSHKEKDSDILSFSGYKILTCSICNNEEMVPEHILESIDEEKEEKLEIKNVAVDGGFDRDIEGDCDTGVCPTR